MNTIRIRICGITHPKDAPTAAEAGVDAVRLVSYAKSKRAVTAAQVEEIAAVLPLFVLAVAPFVNEQPDVIREIPHQVPMGVIQFHGNEDDDFCRQFDRPYLKAVRMQSAVDIRTTCAKFPSTRALLFDAYHSTEYGSMGQSFDWMTLSGDLDKPWILTGGLVPENVADAVRISSAATVDISSDVGNSAGIKDKEKMTAFVVAAKIV